MALYKTKNEQKKNVFNILKYISSQLNKFQRKNRPHNTVIEKNGNNRNG